MTVRMSSPTSRKVQNRGHKDALPLHDIQHSNSTANLSLGGRQRKAWMLETPPAPSASSLGPDATLKRSRPQDLSLRSPSESSLSQRIKPLHVASPNPTSTGPLPSATSGPPITKEISARPGNVEACLNSAPQPNLAEPLRSPYQKVDLTAPDSARNSVFPLSRRTSSSLSLASPSHSYIDGSSDDFVHSPEDPNPSMSAQSRSTNALTAQDCSNDASEPSRKRPHPSPTTALKTLRWSMLSAGSANLPKSDGDWVAQAMAGYEVELGAKITASLRFTGRGPIERPRLELLREACQHFDYSYLMIHQIYCALDLGSQTQSQLHLSDPQKNSFQVLEAALAPNQGLPYDALCWFASFPGPLPTKRSDLQANGHALEWYNSAVESMASLSSNWHSLILKCQARGFPPVVSELRNELKLTSKVLQQVHFRTILRKLVPHQNCARYQQHETIFARNQLHYAPGSRSAVDRLESHDFEFFQEHRKVAEGLEPRLSERGAVGSSRTPRQPYTSSPSHNVQADQRTPLVSSFPIEKPLMTQSSPSEVSSRPVFEYSTYQPINTSLGTRNDRSGLAMQNENRSQVSRPEPLAAPSLVTNLVPPNGATPVYQASHNSATGNAIPIYHSVPNGTPHFPNPSVLRSSHPVSTNGYPVLLSPGILPSSGLSGLVDGRHQAVNNWPTSNLSPSGMFMHHTGPQPTRSSLTPTHHGQTGSPKLERSTLEQCFRYVKRIHKVREALSFWACFAQLRFDLSAAEESATAKDIIGPSGQPTSRLLFPGSLTHRVRCVKIKADASLPTDEQWSAADHSWPAKITVSLNQKPLSFRRKFSYGKDLPVDVTRLVKAGSNELVAALVEPPSKGKDSFVLGFESIETITKTQLMDRLRTVPIDHGILRITRKIRSSDPDIEILDPKILLDLTDPFSATMFTLPVRGESCTHDQCFDLDNFLSSRGGSSRNKGEPCPPEDFLCPICKGDARPGTLIVDGFLRAIREDLVERGRPDVKAVTVSQDGTWVIKEVDQVNGETGDGDGRRRKAPTGVGQGNGYNESMQVKAHGNGINYGSVEIIELDDD